MYFPVLASETRLVQSIMLIIHSMDWDDIVLGQNKVF